MQAAVRPPRRRDTQGSHPSGRDPRSHRGAVHLKSLHQHRMQLLELISAVSEERWCAGWMQGIEGELCREGGVYRLIGSYTGWPIGYQGELGWETWAQARRRWKPQ